MPNYRRAFIQNTYVFLTITTFKRKRILINNIELLRNSFKYAKLKFDFEIYASVILPDHIHLMLKPENINDYPKIIQRIKWFFSLNIPDNNVAEIKKTFSQSKIKRGEKGIWQRRYYEHTIRNDEELNIYTDYIHYNPVKHRFVQNVKDWQYSSFHKFVKESLYDANWGSNVDIRDINIE